MSSMGEDPIWDQFRQDVLLLFERYLGTQPQSDFSKNETAQERGNEHNQILLVTVSNMLYPITMEALYRVFSPHGLVEKIVPLQQSSDFKVLVHFQKGQNAISARKSLHGRCIYDGCCQMSIRFFKDEGLTEVAKLKHDLQFNAMTEVQVFDKMSDDEIMTVIKEDSIGNLETKTSIVPNKNCKEPIEVGVSLCEAEDLNGESPASFMAPFVTQPSGTEPTSDSMVVRFSLHDIFQKVGLSSGLRHPSLNSQLVRGICVDTANQVENDTPTDNYNETYLHVQGEDVLFTVVMDNANNECNESVVKGKSTSIPFGNYNDQFQVYQLTKQSFVSNFTWVVTTDPIWGNSISTVKPHMQPKEVIGSTIHLVSIVESSRTQFMCNLNPNDVGKHCVPFHVSLKHNKVLMNQLFDKDLNMRLGDVNMNLFGLPLFMCTGFMQDRDRNIILGLKSKLVQYMIFNSIQDMESSELIEDIFDPGGNLSVNVILKVLMFVSLSILTKAKRAFGNVWSNHLKEEYQCFISILEDKDSSQRGRYNTSYHIYLPYLVEKPTVVFVDRSLQPREATIRMLKPHLIQAQDRMRSQTDMKKSDCDFMKPRITKVDERRQLDIICATKGTKAWIDKLKWKGKENLLVELEIALLMVKVFECSSKPAGRQEYSSIPMSTSTDMNLDIHDLEHSYHQLDEATNYFVDQAIKEQANQEHAGQLSAHGDSSSRSDASVNTTSAAVIGRVTNTGSFYDSILFIQDEPERMDTHHSSQREVVLTKLCLKHKDRCYQNTLDMSFMDSVTSIWIGELKSHPISNVKPKWNMESSELIHETSNVDTNLFREFSDSIMSMVIRKALAVELKLSWMDASALIGSNISSGCIDPNLNVTANVNSYCVAEPICEIFDPGGIRLYCIDMETMLLVHIWFSTIADMEELLLVHVLFSIKAKKAWGHIWSNQRKKRRSLVLILEDKDYFEGGVLPTRRMERLPRDVVLDILSRLPVTTLAQSKSVCRSWQSIIQGSVLVDKHLSRMSEPENDPCIIFQSPPPLLDHYYFVDFAAYSERHKRLKSFWVSTMHGKLVASSNGLLCFCSSSAIHICNPLTRDSVQLPKLSSDPAELGILGFGFSPTTKEYKVLDIIYQRQRLSSDSHLAPFQSKVQIFTLGDSQWRSLGMAPYQFIARQSQVTASGRLHWISQPGEDLMKDRIISFDLTAEQFQAVPLADHEYNVKESWVKEFIIGGYLPKELRSTNGRIPFFKPDFRVVCSFKGGKILLKLWRKDLVLYDPVHEKFEDPLFEGALQWHEMVVHVGSLASEDHHGPHNTSKGESSAESAHTRTKKSEEIKPPPQRLKKVKHDYQFKKFFDILKHVHINLPLVEALQHMSNYAKFHKDMVTRKKRIEEFETAAAIETCLALMHNKVPAKKADPRSFTIECSIGHKYSNKALCDPGASINLMHKSVFQKLGIGEAKPTTVMLQLADHSFVQPEGKIEDILVRIEKFIFPADLLILDCEADENAPIIHGRPFLSTSRATINFDKDEIVFIVDNEQVKMKAFTKPRQPEHKDKGKGIDNTPAKSAQRPKLYMGAHTERDKRVPSRANLNWVLEFYTNNAASEDNVTFRGRRVAANAATINEILGLPNNDLSVYALLGGLEEEDYETIKDFLYEEGIAWNSTGRSPHSVSCPSLRLEAKLWNTFVKRNLMPTSHN
ncbi:hypothetical protein GQ457_05G018010 [Hibiscus cannabinus]